MREIVDGIFTWSWFSEPHGYDFNGYLIREPEGNLCVDPVEPSEQVLARLVQRGVARIVLTNRNHVRKAALVRERTGAPIAIHPADAAYAQAQGVTIDAGLAAGDQFGSFTVLGVPGKSPGEIALHSPRRRILIVGDAVIGNPPGKLSLLREKVMDDPPLLRASVAALAALEVEVLLPGRRRADPARRGGAAPRAGGELRRLSTVTRDGGAGRRGRRLRFDSAPPSRVPPFGRRPRRLIGAPTAPPPPRCAIRRREQAGDGLSSLHVPRRDEGTRQNGTSPAPP